MIHLNIKSCYSFFYSALKVEDIINNNIPLPVEEIEW